MAWAEGGGGLDLPERWVHADEPPRWADLVGSVAFVRWRVDDWPSLERLHRIDRAARSIAGSALALGLHDPEPAPVPGPRVRDVLLARGTWAPSGLPEPDDELPGEALGDVAIVREGEVREILDGEADLDEVGSALEEASGTEGGAWRPRGAAPGPWPLAYPHDVAVLGSRLAVADTGHNRVIVVRPGGEIVEILGDGVPDHRDGATDQARFQAPRGVCWHEDELLVADTSNDAVRAVDLARGEVRTLAREPGSLPAGLTSTADGDALVALAGSGEVTRLADDGLEGLGAASREIGHPVDVEAAGEEGVLVADLDGARVHRLALDGGSEVAWAGEPLVEPTGLLAGQRPLVADPGLGAVLEIPSEEEPSPPELEAPGARLQAPSALDRETEGLLVADGGGHHLWRLGRGEAAGASRLRLTEAPLALAEHIRLDPIELAPEGDLELALSYLLGEDETVPEDSRLPRARGPLGEIEVDARPRLEEGRVRVELQGRPLASGNLRVRWSLTGGDVGHEAAWDLPIVVRPGADESLRIALSTQPA